MSRAKAVAVVTGAGSGIGRALAMRAARDGFHLALFDRSGEGLAETVAVIEAAGGVARGMVGDVRERAALDAFAAEAEALGPVTLLFANAGILRPGPMVTQSLDEWSLMIDVNLKGLVHTIQAFAGPMRARPSPSRIVVSGSQASLVTYPKQILYSATKHAVLAVAEGLRDEMARTAPQVAVSLLCPGAVATPMTGSNPDYMDPAILTDLAFAGIAANRLWIFSNPQFQAEFEAGIAGPKA
jgi:NAD(P)-dependent dehydrogenase (short-subunit alcohol dehydrogenase family)